MIYIFLNELQQSKRLIKHNFFSVIAEWKNQY